MTDSVQKELGKKGDPLTAWGGLLCVLHIQEPTKGKLREHKKGPEVLQLLFLDGQFSANALQHWGKKVPLAVSSPIKMTKPRHFARFLYLKRLQCSRMNNFMWQKTPNVEFKRVCIASKASARFFQKREYKVDHRLMNAAKGRIFMRTLWDRDFTQRFRSRAAFLHMYLHFLMDCICGLCESQGSFLWGLRSKPLPPSFNIGIRIQLDLFQNSNENPYFNVPLRLNRLISELSY